MAAAAEDYKQNRIAQLEEEIRKWEYELRNTSNEPDREWIRDQIKKLEQKIACIRADTC